MMPEDAMQGHGCLMVLSSGADRCPDSLAASARQRRTGGLVE